MQLSLEHDAFRLALPPEDLDLCRRLGREQDAKQIAADLQVSPSRIHHRLRELETKLRRTRLGVATFGYFLLGFEETKQ